jgi:hypothetical protein
MGEYDPRHDPMLRPCGWSRCTAVPTRLYPAGPRCSEHTPAALNGQPEPGQTATPYRPQFTPTPRAYTVIDDKAVASGKRRSNPREYAQARAREEARRG